MNLYTSCLEVVCIAASQTSGHLSLIILHTPIVASTSPKASWALSCTIPLAGANFSNLKVIFPVSSFNGLTKEFGDTAAAECISLSASPRLLPFVFVKYGGSAH